MQICSKSCFSMKVFNAMWSQFGELGLIQSSMGTHLMITRIKRLRRGRIKQESCITLIQLEILKFAIATQEQRRQSRDLSFHRVLSDWNPNRPTHYTSSSRVINSPICWLQETHAFIHLFYLTYNLHFPVSK